MVRNCIVQIDATPFSQWYANQYNVNLNVKKAKDLMIEEKKSKRAQKRYSRRTESSTLRLLSNSFRKDSSPASVPDQGSPVELRATFSREKNSSSTPRNRHPQEMIHVTKLFQYSLLSLSNHVETQGRSQWRGGGPRTTREMTSALPRKDRGDGQAQEQP